MEYDFTPEEWEAIRFIQNELDQLPPDMTHRVFKKILRRQGMSLPLSEAQYVEVVGELTAPIGPVSVSYSPN